jgi:hypothetical protein
VDPKEYEIPSHDGAPAKKRAEFRWNFSKPFYRRVQALLIFVVLV